MTRKIAVAVEREEGLDPHLNQRFGLAQSFIIVDPETRSILGRIDNVPSTAPSWQGTREALRLRYDAVDTVISRSYGSTGSLMLDDGNIETWLTPDDLSLSEAVDRWITGQLVRLRTISV